MHLFGNSHRGGVYPRAASGGPRRTPLSVSEQDDRKDLTPTASGSATPTSGAVGSVARSRSAAAAREGAEDAVAKVRVVCRLRPMNEREKKAGAVPAVTASTERREVVVARSVAGGSRQVRSTFNFDSVLGSFSTQEDVFAATLRPLVVRVLEGYEATAFAYGQTGTGKTYTMEGDADNAETRGLMPRVAEAVLDALKDDKYFECNVTVSYLEIYNEDLTDLLAPAHMQQRLELMDTVHRRVCCVGLSEVKVTSLADTLDVFRTAQERRRVAETRVNARSSRSHCIFTMKVHCRQRVDGGELETIGKLHLVDLAGSECAKKSGWGLEEGATGNGKLSAGVLAEQDRERRAINQSLLTLGRVIAACREGAARVPYRDSKLTRLLQDALGGSCRTVLIATISPALFSVEETLSSLNYADQASGITNRPVASASLCRQGSSGLQARGDGPLGGEWAEGEMKIMYLSQEVEEAQVALSRKQQEAQENLDRALVAEQELAKVRAESEALVVQAAASERALTQCRAELVASRLELGASREAHAEAAKHAESLAIELAASVRGSETLREGLERDFTDRTEPQELETGVVACLERHACDAKRDARGLRERLEGVEASVASTRVVVASLRAEHEAAVGRTLNALFELTRTELAKLGDGLAVSASQAESALDAAAASLEAASEDSLASETRAATGFCEGVAAASAWSEAATARRAAIGQRVGEALKGAESTAEAASTRLRALQVSSARQAACHAPVVARSAASLETLKENPGRTITKRHLKEPTPKEDSPSSLSNSRAALREVN